MFIIGKSFDSLTAHQVCGLLDTNGNEESLEFIQNNINLDQVNWQKLIHNSLAINAKTEVPGRPVTDFGKSLLQICIENEETVFEGGEGWKVRTEKREP